MGMTLHISPDLAFPADYVTQRTGILGQTGSGKTTTASSLCEELLKHKLPTCIIDPTGAWWGLKSSKDGKSEGYSITVIGGDHGDLPLEESAGRMLAELVAAEAPPLILDLSGFSLAAQRRFMTDFAERLYEKNRTALHLVLDEADEFAPQRIPKGGERLYGAIDKIVRKGRIRGLGVTMICQRSAVIAKDILSQCSTLIAHRTSHPLDLAPILAWMTVHATPNQLKEVHHSIAKLKDGEAWVMSPQFLDFFGRVQMRDRETFNSSATPKAGERRTLPKVLAPVDLEVLRGRMAATIEKAKAEDPRELRRQLADVRADLVRAQKAPAAAPAAAAKSDPNLNALVRQLRKAVEQAMKFIVKINAEDFFKAGGDAIDQEAIQKAISAAVANVTKMLDAKVEKRNQEIEHLRKEAGRILMSLRELAAENVGVEVSVKHNEPFTVSPTPAPRPRPMASNGHDPDGAIPPAAERMLRALATRHPTPLTRRQLATLAKYGSVDGGGFRNTLSALFTRGLVEKRGDLVALSDAGAAYFPQMPGAQTPDELRAMWRAELPPGAQRMLDVVIERAPRGITRAELAAATGYEAVDGGGFRNTLSLLSSNGLIHKAGDEVRAVEELIG